MKGGYPLSALSRFASFSVMGHGYLRYMCHLLVLSLNRLDSGFIFPWSDTKLIKNNPVDENLNLMKRYAVTTGKYLSTLEGLTILRNVGSNTPM